MLEFLLDSLEFKVCYPVILLVKMGLKIVIFWGQYEKIKKGIKYELKCNLTLMPNVKKDVILCQFSLILLFHQIFALSVTFILPQTFINNGIEWLMPFARKLKNLKTFFFILFTHF